MTGHTMSENRTGVGLHLLALTLLLGVVTCGCSMRYMTPRRGIELSSLISADTDIAERMLREPAASFPARMAVVRVQAPNYRSHRVTSYGEGNYSVVTVLDMESEEHFARLERLPQVTDVARLNRLVIPRKLETVKELRLAAASLKADVLLVYTVDTIFRVDEYDVGPLTFISLGLLPTKEASVTATVSAALFDVRTGYVYALAEATARARQIANSWTSADAVDRSRRRAEAQAFDQLIDNFEGAWKDIVEEYSAGSRSDKNALGLRIGQSKGDAHSVMKSLTQAIPVGGPPTSPGTRRDESPRQLVLVSMCTGEFVVPEPLERDMPATRPHEEPKLTLEYLPVPGVTASGGLVEIDRKVGRTTREQIPRLEALSHCQTEYCKLRVIDGCQRLQAASVAAGSSDPPRVSLTACGI